MSRSSRSGGSAGGDAPGDVVEQPDPEALADELRRARELRFRVDLTCAVLRQGRLPRPEAQALVAATRRAALELFPGKDDVFDLVLAPRFTRLVEEFSPPRTPARVLPFRRS